VRILKLAGQRGAAAEASGCWRYLLEWRRMDAGSPAVAPLPSCLWLAPNASAPCLHRVQDPEPASAAVQSNGCLCCLC